LDSQEIRALIELIAQSSFTTFELERDGFRIKLVKGETPALQVAPRPEPASSAAARPQPAEPSALPPLAAEPATESAPPRPTTDAAVHELHSPIVGTFYRAAGPDSTPFVEIGSRVKKGQVICIVEAMKVMNEIESEIDGEVLEILVANAQPVEYGEVLLRLRPIG
jgi:acetyl-CoA carboxylase biotin carboxyl carrier protein